MTKLIANILSEAELTEATTSKMEVVQQEGASDFDKLQLDSPEGDA